MKAHELAQELLQLPNLEIMFVDSIGPMELGSAQESEITEQDAEDCGDCEDRVGEKYIALYKY
jgi:hypothetical protein